MKIRSIRSWAGVAAFATVLSATGRADDLGALASTTNDAPNTASTSATASTSSNSKGSGVTSAACKAITAMDAYYQWSSSSAGSPTAAQSLQISTSTSGTSGSSASSSSSNSGQSLGTAAVTAYTALEQSLEPSNNNSAPGSSICTLVNAQGQSRQVDANDCNRVTTDLQQNGVTNANGQSTLAQEGQSYLPNPCLQAKGIANLVVSSNSGISGSSSTSSTASIAGISNAPGFAVSPPTISGGTSNTATGAGSGTNATGGNAGYSGTNNNTITNGGAAQ